MLFADVNMPGLSGRELAERARDFRPQLRVLLVSGLESDGRGFPLLRKPFTQSDLRRVMADTTGFARTNPLINGNAPCDIAMMAC
jgi:CheY-like chemotaxis protein